MNGNAREAADAEWSKSQAGPERNRNAKANGQGGPVGCGELPWPARLGDDAYHGLIGEIVRSVELYTEADPNAILLHLLTGLGNCLGGDAYLPIDGARHKPNLFILIVGRTARGRKGTAWSRARQFLDGQWAKHQVAAGLSTGEGLIQRVRDPKTEIKTDKAGMETLTETDPGVTDKRLLVIEEEFSRTLRAMTRPENTLSPMLRLAWDGRSLEIMTRGTPIIATDPHISVIGHITLEELQREVTETTLVNGFINRFLIVCAQRSRLLPFGGEPDPAIVRDLRIRVKQVIDAPRFGPVTMDPAARCLWEPTYEKLTRERLGMFGAATARAEAQVLRIALIYALVDRSTVIGEHHLRAAFEVWRYASESARFVFGDLTGDPIADTIMRELREAGSSGRPKSDLHNVFARNVSAARLDQALRTLQRFGLADSNIVRTSGPGRPLETWVAL